MRLVPRLDRRPPPARLTHSARGSIDGASILMFEPTGTSTVGDRHDEVPSHVDATTGHALALWPRALLSGTYADDA
ncbi:hypothetical protein ACFQ9J_01120 [Streptomyces sp. NPDC056529]|uniref:hypothetical protein n=1 Tax=Streptomyces sp. NPDC056529 TaxID=3345855 RepID=UPI0036ACA772